MAHVIEKRKEHKKLPMAVLRDMEYILIQIENGNYEHYQGRWHCGSAHCFLGWKITRDLKNKANIELEPANANAFTETYRNSFEVLAKAREILGVPNFFEPDSIEAYCGREWGLTKDELGMLATSSNTVQDLRRMIDMFKKGYRYCTVHEYLAWDWHSQAQINYAYALWRRKAQQKEGR
jgi:hypothetical protein